MARANVANLVDRVAHRAADDAGFANVLQTLVDAPTQDVAELQHITSRFLNQSRRKAAMAEFLLGSCTTAEVRQLLDRSSPQAVHVLRSRGKLLGHTLGNVTYFPAWQFDGPAIRRDLAAVLAALRRYTDDTVAADRVMRLARTELGGSSLVEALDDPPRAETAWNILSDLGSGH